jgi:hypothetical protein
LINIFAKIWTSDIKNISVVIMFNIDVIIINRGEFRINFLITRNYVGSIIVLLLMNSFPAIMFRISKPFFDFLINLLSFLVNKTTFIFYIYYIITNITNLLIIIILRILVYETHLFFLLAVKFPRHTFLFIIVLLFLF